MSDNELEKIRQRKAEMLMKLQAMPKAIINIKSEGELYKLSEEFNGKIIIIDFWAAWCSPCKMFAPIFERVQQEYSGDFIFAKINVDENPMVAQRYGIASIPTTLFIKGGQPLRKIVGAVNYATLKQMLDKLRSD
ncbi:MAG: thioredoxin [Candidatus Hermodarchaeota archaeon]